MGWKTSATMIMLLLTTILMMASNVKIIYAEEPNLITILDSLGFKNIKESTAETFIPGTYNVTLYAEFTNYHAQNNLSWYVVGTAEYNLIFSGQEGNFSYVDPPISKSFTANSKFGLSFFSPEARYFTETSKNPDGIKHAMIYVDLDVPDRFLIGFENWLGGGDKDYNDMVISLELISPSVVNINGKNWYFRNATNNKAFLFLDGAEVRTDRRYCLWVMSFDDPRVNKSQKLPLINDLVQNSFDCLINKDYLYYDGSQTWLKDAVMWLWERGYNGVFLFGFSGGGVVVAYEIQKDYAPTIFSAAVIASAPVAWDGWTGIFQSAHTASLCKVGVSFIAPESDPPYIEPITLVQMGIYYNNMLTQKEWHNFTGNHDIFSPETCKNHPEEDAQTATLNWYNVAHPPNTPLTPSGPTYGYVGASYTYFTNTTDPNGDNVYYQLIGMMAQQRL